MQFASFYSRTRTAFAFGGLLCASGGCGGLATEKPLPAEVVATASTSASSTAIVPPAPTPPPAPTQGPPPEVPSLVFMDNVLSFRVETLVTSGGGPKFCGEYTHADVYERSTRRLTDRRCADSLVESERTQFPAISRVLSVEEGRELEMEMGKLYSRAPRGPCGRDGEWEFLTTSIANSTRKYSSGNVCPGYPVIDNLLRFRGVVARLMR